MAEESRAVTAAHPPAAILRAVNPVLRRLLGTPLLGGARKQFMVLNFSGRKTGRRYSIPVSAHVIGGDLYALAGAPWTKNFRGGHAVDVVHDGKTVAMRGELVTDAAAVADLSHRAAESYGAKHAQRVMGLKFRGDVVPALDEFKRAVEAEDLVAIRLTSTG
jgi:hypothetical protein